jgi:hypothetical protein
MGERSNDSKSLFPSNYGAFEHRIDPAAYYTAVRQNGLPDSVLTPTLAVDRSAIEEFVGEIVRVYGQENAYLVRGFRPFPVDHRYPIWTQPNADRIHQEYQVWVRVSYTRYRAAFRNLVPTVNIDGLILHHVPNRRYAKKCGFEYIRLVPISRASNSSSAFSEDWGVNLDKVVPNYFEKHRARGYRIKYADLTDLLAIMDMQVGGGVMEVVRLAQDLVEVPGARPSQKSFS